MEVIGGDSANDNVLGDKADNQDGVSGGDAEDDGNGGHVGDDAVEVSAGVEVGGHYAVDLELPSGVKWATCNVGASSPEEYGGYYAWGETEEKENYDWDTYKHCDKSFSKLNKYNTNSSYGTKPDNKTKLEAEDDVACVKWGGSWRMPTKTEINELIDNCSWTLVTKNGVKGYVVASNANGNSIFLPAAGYCWSKLLYFRSSNGYYWSASLCEDNAYDADVLYILSGSRILGNGRCNGFSVRPVTE